MDPEVSLGVAVPVVWWMPRRVKRHVLGDEG
jgi:hypothetical protein